MHTPGAGVYVPSAGAEPHRHALQQSEGGSAEARVVGACLILHAANLDHAVILHAANPDHVCESRELGRHLMKAHAAPRGDGFCEKREKTKMQEIPLSERTRRKMDALIEKTLW